MEQSDVWRIWFMLIIMKKYGGEAITEQNLINGNTLTIDHVYNAIRNLKPEYQGILLSQYKLFDLYTLLGKDIKEYDQYLTGIINSANEYLKLFGALVDLYMGVCKEQSANASDSMAQAYDRLPEEDKKRVCGVFLGKREFFENAYKVMMGVFEGMLETQKEKNEDRIGSDKMQV